MTTPGFHGVELWRPRTSLWLIPTIEVVAAVLLFSLTYQLDQAAYAGDVTRASCGGGGPLTSERRC